MDEKIDAAAHDGLEDCAYNFGRECDCSAPAALLERVQKAGLALVDIDAYRRVTEPKENDHD